MRHCGSRTLGGRGFCRAGGHGGAFFGSFLAGGLDLRLGAVCSRPRSFQLFLFRQGEMENIGTAGAGDLIFLAGAERSFRHVTLEAAGRASYDHGYLTDVLLP
jgi:hypothetical protein